MAPPKPPPQPVGGNGHAARNDLNDRGAAMIRDFTEADWKAAADAYVEFEREHLPRELAEEAIGHHFLCHCLTEDERR